MMIQNTALYEDQYAIHVNREGDTLFYFFDYDVRSAEINMQFKWADSETTYDEMEDFYCDGDVAPLGRLNYVYQNYIPGVSEITYPNTETETTAAETTAPTEPVTEGHVTEPATEVPAATETDTATVDNKRGCSSPAALLPVAAVLVAAAAVVARKKKD